MSADIPRAVLFDMDGVLIDSFDMWLHAMNDAARELGQAPIGRAALDAAFGQGIEDDLRTFFPGCTREALEDAYARALPAHEHRISTNPTARDLLAGLAARGIARALVTNTQHDAVAGLLAHADLEGCFEAVQGITPAIAGKPAPDLLLRACAAFGIPPEAALMVGDSRYDREAAAAAGTDYLHYELRRGDDLAVALRPALGIR